MTGTNRPARRGRVGRLLRSLAIVPVAVLAACASLGSEPGWTSYVTRLADYEIRYALPSDGIEIEKPLPEKELVLGKREKVSLFASLGYGPRDPDGPPPAQISLGFGGMPGGAQPETPSVERLGDLVLGEARATHPAIRYESGLERIGKATWFRLENHVQDSDGVQPEAVVYYRPLDASYYLFVWGIWKPSMRRTQQDIEERQRVLRRAVESCRVRR